MDKLTAISVFRKVIEQGSFKAAADEMGLSNATISKNIKELEDYLKTPLINRTTRSMHITDSGQIYYDHVCAILDSMTLADLSILNKTSSLHGTLKISIPMSLGLLTINAAVCEFISRFDELSIKVVMSDSYVDLVDHGFDIAIRGGSGQLKNSSLKSRKLLKINYVLCASPKYLKNRGKINTPNDLMAHNCLTYSLSHLPRQWVFSNTNETLVIDLPPATYCVNNSIALKQAILANIGVTLTPEIYVKSEIETGELVRLLPEWQTACLDLYALYPYHQEQSYKVRLFIDFLIEYLHR